ncbi:MAG: hypothetical protein ACLVES_06530 [Faecalibacterium prausnitzii]
MACIIPPSIVMVVTPISQRLRERYVPRRRGPSLSDHHRPHRLNGFNPAVRQQKKREQGPHGTVNERMKIILDARCPC